MDSSHDSWENEVLFVKIGARVLDLWLDTSSGPKWPKCTFQVPGPKFKKFFEISWFYWIHLIILEKMAGYFFWVQVAQINVLFLGSRSQGQDSFWDFMILLDSSHHLWENEVLFVKIGARVLDLCYYGWICLLGQWPKYSF